MATHTIKYSIALRLRAAFFILILTITMPTQGVRADDVLVHDNIENNTSQISYGITLIAGAIGGMGLLAVCIYGEVDCSSYTPGFIISL